MKNKALHFEKHQSIPENNLLQMYLAEMASDPKSPDISTSLYLTCIAIRILEKIGNIFPTQAEIDSVEAYLRRFSRRKIFDTSCGRRHQVKS